MYISFVFIFCKDATLHQFQIKLCLIIERIEPNMLIMETQRCRYHLCKLLCLFLFVNNQSGVCNGYKPEMPSTYVKRNDPNESQHATDEKTNVFRKGKDLIYEAMKMRTGIWPPQGKDLEKVVGGGLLEKQLFSSPAFSHARENPDIAIRFESRGIISQ